VNYEAPELRCPRAVLTVLAPPNASLLWRYYRDNAAHLEPWEPARAPDFYEQRLWPERVRQSQLRSVKGEALHLVALSHDRARILGVVNFTTIRHGVFKACNLGYSIAASEQGQGLMFELLSRSIEHVFARYDLHRIMAGYLPRNERSGALLQRLGFEREGYARGWLKIAGRWEDHVLTSRLNQAHS
jgi:[ribosomal protein S5]-alanine N-acetyltransferase